MTPVEVLKCLFSLRASLIWRVLAFSDDTSLRQNNVPGLRLPEKLTEGLL